jgi:hypothetical protein
MLAVVSDGCLDGIAAGQKLITTLHRAGCAVLCCSPPSCPVTPSPTLRR